MTRPSILDQAFTSALLEVGHLYHDIDFAEWCHHIRVVDASITRLCDALDVSAGDSVRLARDAYLAVLALAQVLWGAYSDDERTSNALELTQLAIGRLLDALEPYVAADVRLSRRVLLDGEPLDASLTRLFCA